MIKKRKRMWHLNEEQDILIDTKLKAIIMGSITYFSYRFGRLKLDLKSHNLQEHKKIIYKIIDKKFKGIKNIFLRNQLKNAVNLMFILIENDGAYLTLYFEILRELAKYELKNI
jgi:hypothetical protein